jgi:hypothetical protein
LPGALSGAMLRSQIARCGAFEASLFSKESIMELMLIIWLLSAGIAAFIAQSKGRSVVEGVLLGLLLSIIGVVIEICLPNKKQA